MKQFNFSFTIILCIIFLANSCDSPLGIEDQVRITKTLKFTTILKGPLVIMSDDAFQKVIQSKDEENSFAASLVTNKFDTAGKPQPITFPEINYSKEMIVAICLGSRPLANYEVEITSAESIDGNVTIHAKEYVPSIGQTVISSPIHFIRLEKYNGTVKFDKIEVVHL